jgi:hypothetical protein
LHRGPCKKRNPRTSRQDCHREQPTEAGEFHGNYSCLIQAIEAWEQAFGRTAMLPIEEVQIENQCGYIFRESTNQIKYIEEYEYQQSDCA